MLAVFFVPAGSNYGEVVQGGVAVAVEVCAFVPVRVVWPRIPSSS